jgi:hypothetical protein
VSSTKVVVARGILLLAVAALTTDWLVGAVALFLLARMAGRYFEAQAHG